MRASVVIPSWNGRPLLARVLDALAKQERADFETIVVDNGSTDGTVAWLEQSHPHVRTIALPRNMGFAAAANAGIRAARHEAVVMLNNDTEPEAGWLAALLEPLARDAEVGIVASKMLTARDTDIIDSAGDGFGLRPEPIGMGDRDGAAYADPRDVLSACAGAAAYRASMLREVGNFEERYFAYFEDVDLGLRARWRGWRIRYAPDARVTHVHFATAERLGSLRHFLGTRNLVWLYLRVVPLSLAVRRLPVVVAISLLDGMHAGNLAFVLRALGAALAGAPRALASRRMIMSSRRAEPADIARLFGAAPEAPGWFTQRMRPRSWRLTTSVS